MMVYWSLFSATFVLFVQHSEVVRGLNECIVRLESDSSRRISASMQVRDELFCEPVDCPCFCLIFTTLILDVPDF